MKVKIIEIERSGYDPYEDKIFSFSILAKLENERLVWIRDEKPFDLRAYIGKIVDLLIWISYMNKINSINKYNDKENIKNPIIKAKYLGKYNIPEKWNQCNGFKLKKEKFAIEYDGMIFLITQSDFERQGIEINKGDEIIFQAAGLDLIAWLPINEK